MVSCPLAPSLAARKVSSIAVRMVSPSNAKPRARRAMSQRSFTRVLVAPKSTIASSFSAISVSRRVSPEAGDGQVEQCRVVLLLPVGRDDIAEADVHLQVQPRLAKVAPNPHAKTPVLRLVADIRHLNRRRVEDNAVLEAWSVADRVQCHTNAGTVSRPHRKKVNILGRPQLVRSPHPEERRALERESVHLARAGKTIEEPLDSVSI